MKINFNIKRTFKINGKEYKSFDEMPPGIRALFEKASSTKAGSGRGEATNTTAKIVFNGVEYESSDAMPTYIRNLYENVMNPAGRRPRRAVADATG